MPSSSRSVIGILVAVMLILVAGAGLLYRTENVVSKYATYADAERDRAIARGWIPSFVPPSARAIREVHNIDSNRQWLRFELPEPDARRMVAALSPISFHEARARAEAPPRWSGPWPSELGEYLLTPRASLTFHRDAAPATGARCVVVAWAEQPIAAYVWSC
jgi:hypothetical protein